MTNQEAKDRLISLRTSYKIRIEEEDIEALDKGIAMLEDKTGHWDDSCSVVSDGSLWKSWVCSKCDNRVMVKTPYCCNCGAKMKGE